MGSITIANKYKITCSTPDDFYIGRGSPLGNPYPIGPASTREQVIDRYAEWLAQQIQQENPTVLTELNRIADRLIAGKQARLICFCAPKVCHGQVIQQTILSALKANP